MKELKLRELYSRRDIHGIFSPETPFTPRAGTWGLHGIIKVPDTDNDFVFIVTYGQSQGDHSFDEGISDDGVLTWQSQPSQDLNNPIIAKLIKHDDLIDNIYLFLRESKKDDYQYLGRLAYLEHDLEREKPVYFQWQLLDWDQSAGQSNTSAQKSSSRIYEKIAPKQEIQSLNYVNKLPSPKRTGVTKEVFRAKKSPDYAAKDASNRELGLKAELLVLDYERIRLINAGKGELASKVIHTSVVQGDGAGFDIKSFNDDGSIRYIEVKATRGSLNSDFYMSPNELKFSALHASSYYLYRIYDMNSKSGQASFFILEGDVSKRLLAIPVNYRMSFLQ